MELKSLVPNVFEFIDRASELVGKREAEFWSQDSYCELVESPINSPIEQLFYVAVKTLCRAIGDEFNPAPIVVGAEPKEARGIYLLPQHKVGKYRVDFCLFQVGCGPESVEMFAIELDGHAFHDKDKRQRAYEKARDRFLVAKGYRVLHFTGSEIVADPFAAAHECLRALRVCVQDEYNPDDPLECGL